MNERRDALKSMLGEAILSPFLTEVIHTQNLIRTKKHLERGGKAIIYTNHVDRLDSEPTAKTVIERIAPLNENAYVMVSLRYLDAEREGSAAIAKTLNFLQSSFGFNFLPMVQDKPEEKERYKDWKKINMRSFRQALDALNNKPGSIICVTPEGTRSTTGALLEAQIGFEKLLEKGGKDVIAQPMAIVHTKVRPLKMRTRILIPEPFTYQEILKEKEEKPDLSVTELAMLKIARELPKQNQGFYEDLV